MIAYLETDGIGRRRYYDAGGREVAVRRIVRRDWQVINGVPVLMVEDAETRQWRPADALHWQRVQAEAWS